VRLLAALVAALVQPGIHVGAQPTGLAYGAGSLWSANSGAGTVSRVDIVHRRVTRTIRVGVQPAAIAFAAGAVWVGDFTQNSVFRIDPATNRIVATIPIDTMVGGFHAAADGSLWVSEYNAGAVVRIDPATNTITEHVRVGGQAHAIAELAGLLWVANTAGYVSAIDTAAGKVVGATIDVGHGVDGLVATPEGLWATTYDRGVVALIDPTSRKIVRRTRIKGHVAAIVLANGALWVSDFAHGRVTRIDRKTAAIRESRSTGAKPAALVRIGRALWVATQSPPRLVRIPLL
jgi:YVTN family beta-propeller protein